MFKVFGLKADGSEVDLNFVSKDPNVYVAGELAAEHARCLSIQGNPQDFTQVVVRTMDGKPVPGLNDEQDCCWEIGRKYSTQYGVICCPICRHEALWKNHEVDETGSCFFHNETLQSYYCYVCGINFWMPLDLKNPMTLYDERQEAEDAYTGRFG